MFKNRVLFWCYWNIFDCLSFSYWITWIDHNWCDINLIVLKAFKHYFRSFDPQLIQWCIETFNIQTFNIQVAVQWFQQQNSLKLLDDDDDLRWVWWWFETISERALNVNQNIGIFGWLLCCVVLCFIVI